MSRPALLRGAISVVLLAGVLAVTDAAAILQRLAAIDPPWVVAAVLLAGLQVGLSAARWRFTARRLGLRLDFVTACREYYLATFLNQVLPGGVAGDAARAWRHGRVEDRLGPSVRAVILERASGQLVMAVVAMAAVVAVPGAWPALLDHARWLTGGVLSLALLALAVVIVGRRLPRLGEPLRRFRRDAWCALLAPRVLPFQLLTSLLVVATYLLVFVIAARAIGIDTPLRLLLPLAPLVLLAMLLPVSLSGWGVREAAAAVIWPLADLPAADGVAVAITYGLLILLGSLPGAVVMLLGR